VPWANRAADIGSRWFEGQLAGAQRLAETPRAVMSENPYASGTELADWYDRARQSAASEFGPAMGLNMVLAGTGGAGAGPGEVIFGAGRKLLPGATKPLMMSPERIVGATYTVNGKTYTAPNHVLAMDQAVKDLGLGSTSDLVDLHDPTDTSAALQAHRAANGFMTSEGRVVDRKQADSISRAAQQGAGYRESLKSEDLGGTTAPATFQWPRELPQYVDDPQRIYKPGIYKDPRAIAAEANARVEPEHPALKQLFGVTRNDLYDISQQGTRQGNVAPNIWTPQRPGTSYAAENVMTPANAQRMIDTLTEARKYPGLERGMVPWYVMDPAYARLEQLVGPERAVGEYNKFNYMMTPFSASSDVMKEINRGTAARMMAERGQLPEFAKYGGMPVETRGPDFPPEMADVIPHLRHGMHVLPATRWAETGTHGYGQETVKIPLYTQASGVPQTGFQTAWPVPDAHFTRAVAMSDVRKNAGPGDYMVGSEYRSFAPWYRANVAQPLGLEAVPAQALTWGAYAPQTGVKTPIGAGKLELLSRRIWERAQKLGVDPKLLRDQVLLGQQHSALEDQPSFGSVSRYG
jgi:hypothetical protein